MSAVYYHDVDEIMEYFSCTQSSMDAAGSSIFSDSSVFGKQWIGLFGQEAAAVPQAGSRFTGIVPVFDACICYDGFYTDASAAQL